jgi:hypothetical protein
LRCGLTRGVVEAGCEELLGTARTLAQAAASVPAFPGSTVLLAGVIARRALADRIGGVWSEPPRQRSVI